MKTGNLAQWRGITQGQSLQQQSTSLAQMQNFIRLTLLKTSGLVIHRATFYRWGISMVKVYWCMISNDAPSSAGDAIHWLRHANPTVLGVSHDRANTVYPHTPPAELAGERVLLEPNLALIDAETGDDGPMMAELMTRLASSMTQASHDIMLIDREYLKRLFNTPHHRLWCANYDDESRTQFDADWAAALPMPQPDLPFLDLQLQARAIIKAAFS